MAPLPDEWRPETLAISKLRDEAETQLVSRIHARLAATLGRSIDTAAPESLRALLGEAFPAALDEERVVLNRTDRLRLQDAVFAEVVGYGPLQDLLVDDSYSEIMVNGPKQVWVEKDGRAVSHRHHVQRRRSRHSGHPADRLAARAALRRVEPDGRCSAAGWQPRERDHPAAVADRTDAHDPKVPPRAIRFDRPAAQPDRHRRSAAVPRDLRARPPEHASWRAGVAPARRRS